MRLYIAGPMSGIEDFNYPAFHLAERHLLECGFEVRNPAHTRFDADAEWADYMRSAIRQVTRCDGVALLPGWNLSQGAQLEFSIASRLGMPVGEVWMWIYKGVTIDGHNYL